MRSKDKLEQDVFLSPFFPSSASVLHSWLIYLTPHPKWHNRMGMGGCSQFIAHSLCYSFLLTLFPSCSLGCSAKSLFIRMFLCSLLWAFCFNCFVKEPEIPQWIKYCNRPFNSWKLCCYHQNCNHLNIAELPLSTCFQL